MTKQKPLEESFTELLNTLGNDLAPDLRDHLIGTAKAWDTVENDYNACKTIEDKIDYVFQLVKSQSLALVIKDIQEAQHLDSLMGKTSGKIAGDR